MTPGQKGKCLAHTLLWLYSMLATSTRVAAQTADESALASATSFRCEFPIIVANNWHQDDAATSLKKQRFAFQIDAVDVRKGRARLIGNIGAEDLTVIVGNGLVHFLERTLSGNLNLTTVFAERAKDGRFKSVHSRHILMVGGPLPSQAYGHCKAWN